MALSDETGDYETFKAALQVSSAHSLLSIARSLEALATCADNENFAYRVFVVRGKK